MLDGDLGEHLAVELDVAGLERGNELGVVRAVQTSRRVDAHLLETAIVALLQLATNIGVFTGFRRCRFGERDLGFAPPHHALGTGHDILAALDAVSTALYTRHIRLVGLDERLDRADVLLGNGEVAALVAGDLAGFTAIEVVLAALALQELAALGNDHALGEGLGGFLLHMSG